MEYVCCKLAVGTYFDRIVLAVQQALDPVNARVKIAVDSLSSFIQQQPDLDFDIPSGQQAESWLLTTYLDDDTRISRGDGGSIFVLVKDVGIPSMY